MDGSDESGHGTIVASIAAGQPSNISSYFGVAPDSKIAFFDIGDSNGDLYIPSDLNNELLKPLHNTGATVSSHSWGSTSNSYTVDARSVDKFMWDNPDALVLMSGKIEMLFAILRLCITFLIGCVS